MARGHMALPSFHLNELADEDVTVSCEAQPDELGLLPEEAVVRGPLSLTMTVGASGRLVQVQGEMAGTFVRECVRCLREYDERIHLPFSGRYRMPDPAPGRRSRTKTVQDPDATGVVETPEEDEETYVCSGEGSNRPRCCASTSFWRPPSSRCATKTAEDCARCADA